MKRIYFLHTLQLRSPKDRSYPVSSRLLALYTRFEVWLYLMAPSPPIAGSPLVANRRAGHHDFRSTSDVRITRRPHGSPARNIHAHHLRQHHHGADASSNARHRTSGRLHRSADEVCTPSRDYQTRYAVRESRAARRHLPAPPLESLFHHRRTNAGSRPHASRTRGSASVGGLKWKSTRICADLDAKIF